MENFDSIVFESMNIQNEIISPRRAKEHGHFQSTAIKNRNKSWQKSDYIPSWVNIDSVGLDQFFTRPEIARQCWNSLNNYINDAGLQQSDYKFIEPSAGLGAFYDLLPANRRIGIDVDSFSQEFVTEDFLSWTPSDNTGRYACVGNPPFGYRAWLALSFLNHASKFSDFVGFILPMSFQSRGKSNVQDRVKGLHLVHSERLPQDSFVDINGKPLKVNALWQIWSRVGGAKKVEVKTCDQYIDLFTVDMRKERLCGKARLHEASFFLQRTFYTDPPQLVKTFDQVKYVCGYGIVIKRDKRKVLQILQNANWEKHSNLTSHNCRHISMCHIREVLTQNGLVDV